MELWSKKRDSDTTKHLWKHFPGGKGSRGERGKGRGEFLFPIPWSTVECQATKKVPEEGGTQGRFCSPKLQINVGKGLLLPPALAIWKSGVHTKPGVMTARSGNSKTGMKNHPVSPSTDYRGTADDGFRLVVHPVTAKGRGKRKTDLTSICLCDNRMLQAS